MGCRGVPGRTDLAKLSRKCALRYSLRIPAPRINRHDAALHGRKKDPMALTIEQKIAQAEAELARLRTKVREADAGRKIILGGMLLAAARRDPQIRAWMLAEVESQVTRDHDRKRLEPTLAELRSLPMAQALDQDSSQNGKG